MYYKIRINDRMFVVNTKKIRTALSRAVIRYFKTVKNVNEFYLGKNLFVTIVKKSKSKDKNFIY